MRKVKLAIIGLGNMGSAHVKAVKNLANAELVAVCDIKRERADKIGSENGVKSFYSATELFAAKVAEAIIIAVPHYSHTPIAIEAFENGVHVLCEKPIAVTKSDAQKMIDAHAKHPELRFALMFQQRTHNAHKKIKKLIEAGEFGKIMRVNWIITTWYRTQCYYDSGDWRATWRGEGGGVLLNQCPHHLDLFQWFFGLPESVRSFVSIGKYHDIEVEDEVNTLCRFADGSTGCFITSTGECPGTNRLEITGTRGRMVFEDGVIKFLRNEIPVDVFTKESQSSFAVVPSWDITIPTDKDTGHPHQDVIEKFVAAVLDPKAELVAQGEEGIRSIELGNAMLYSGLKDVEVKLPMDTVAFDEMLAELIKKSRYVKKSESGNIASTEDMGKSF